MVLVDSAPLHERLAERAQLERRSAQAPTSVIGQGQPPVHLCSVDGHPLSIARRLAGVVAPFFPG